MGQRWYAGWKRGDPIQYIRKDIPSFSVPPLTGERYEAMVPDTLDIQDRAALAVNGLTGPTDPEKDHLLYFTVDYSSNPPRMVHAKSDICQTKFEESLPLMRTISGSSLNDHIDPVWMAVALRQIGPDGLFYWPYFPWAKYADWGKHQAQRAYMQDVPPLDADWSSVPIFCGRRMGAMTLYMLRDRSGPWNAEIQKIVHGLWSIAIDKGDYAYFPQGEFLPGQPRVSDAAMPVGIWSSLVGWTIQGLAQYHRVSAYEPAITLAAKLSRYLVRHGRYYGPHGEFLPNYAGDDGGVVSDRDGVPGFGPGPTVWKEYIHFQHHTVPLLGLLDYALAAGDHEAAEFVRQAFEWARARGNTLVGYFPENIDHAEWEGSETCEVAGMIGLALKLSAAGLGDYWDDADRWIRNQFAENQLRRADWLYRFPQAGLIYPRRRVPLSQVDDVTQTVDRVPERNIGTFAGWPSANDFYTGQGIGGMHCCTGNGTRALYYIWEHTLAYRDGELKVNLLLNRPSPWADIHSYIPYEGQVDIEMKRSCHLKIRLPEWVKSGQFDCQIDGTRHEVGYDGRYAVVGPVSAKAVVQVRFPIGERVEAVDIEKQRYILTIKGNDVVDIDPPGRFCPYYERDSYRDNVVRWRKTTRFVSADEIRW
jgi:hypothetical protein